MKTITMIAALLVACGVSSISAQIPQTISYQGRLTQSGQPVADGSYSLTFRLYEAASGGTALWTETQTTGVSNGLFTVRLGATVPLTAAFDKSYWFTVSAAGGAESGRTPLAATAYSLNSQSVVNGAVTTSKLADNAVTAAKILPNIVSSVDGVSNDGGNIDLIAGSNITITPSDAANTITIAATGTGGDITAVNAGTGLSGGGSTGDVTLNVRVPLRLQSADSAILVAQMGFGDAPAIKAISSAYGKPAIEGICDNGPGAGVYGSGHEGIRGNGALNGVVGEGTWIGVQGITRQKYGLAGVQGLAYDSGGVGVIGHGFSMGVLGATDSGTVGVFGSCLSKSGVGVRGLCQHGPEAIGVEGNTFYGKGVFGTSITGYGVYGWADGTGTGILGISDEGDGLVGYASADSKSGIFAVNAHPDGFAGFFTGRVHVNGTLSKSAGSFKIDHPLDPANKYLQHSFVESPDMMNVYNGEVTLDASGAATVSLPAYFESLNKDFRYQLTCIGGYAPVYIAERISGNQFKIAGGTPGLAVSWQITGIRHDAYANAHRIEVEVDKQGEERGKYLSPTEHGASETLGINYNKIKELPPTNVGGMKEQK